MTILTILLLSIPCFGKCFLFDLKGKIEIKGDRHFLILRENYLSEVRIEVDLAETLQTIPFHGEIVTLSAKLDRKFASSEAVILDIYNIKSAIAIPHDPLSHSWSHLKSEIKCQ